MGRDSVFLVRVQGETPVFYRAFFCETLSWYSYLEFLHKRPKDTFISPLNTAHHPLAPPAAVHTNIAQHRQQHQRFTPNTPRLQNHPHERTGRQTTRSAGRTRLRHHPATKPPAILLTTL